MQETKEDAKERIDRAYAQFDRRLAGRAQASEMMMHSGSLVAKSILLINGGAAIALLAFLANVFAVNDLDTDRARLMGAFTIACLFCLGRFRGRGLHERVIFLPTRPRCRTMTARRSASILRMSKTHQPRCDGGTSTAHFWQSPS